LRPYGPLIVLSTGRSTAEALPFQDWGR
jgi:hypothetical protein